MASDCLTLQLGPVAGTELKQLKGLQLVSLNARIKLNGQPIGCSNSSPVHRSTCNFGHEMRSTLVKTHQFVFASNPTGKAQQRVCRLSPLANSLCKDEMMDEGGSRGTAEVSQMCQSDQAEKAQSSPSSLPGFIYPSATTVGKSTNIVWQQCMVTREEREKLLKQRGCVIWITGLSGSGKSTLACTLDHQLSKRGNLSYVLDGDNLRHSLNNNLGFSMEDRAENIRRIGEVAKLFVDAGIICIASAISPYKKDRDACRQLLQPGEFIECYMNFPLLLCEKRDPKGLYKLARAGKIKGFTGIDDPYEAPLNSEVVMELIDGRCPTPTEMASRLLSYLEQNCFV